VSGFVVGTMNSATIGYGRMIALGNNPGNDDSGTLQCPFLLRQNGNIYLGATNVIVFSGVSLTPTLNFCLTPYVNNGANRY